jgi:uncharacterized protein (DUF1330 family)
MAVYVVADIEVVDAAGFEEYRLKAPAVLAAYGGRYLARNGESELLEGSWLPKLCVILEFPDMDKFRVWWSSPEYVSLRAIRQRTTKSHLILTQGV